MGWSETRRRWQVLRELEAELGRRAPERGLPWNEEYAEVFGDRATMVAMLRYHWQMYSDAQSDPHLTEAVQDELRKHVDDRFAGVRRFVLRYEAAAAHGAGAGRTTGGGHVAA